MGDIVLPTTTLQANDGTNNLLAKILTRLNLNASGQVDQPTANVAVTNTPLPVDFNGTQPVSVQGQAHVIVDNGHIHVEVDNFPATQPVSVTNFPATQNVAVTNTPNVDTGADYTDDGHLTVMNTPFEFEIAHSGTYLENGVNKSAFQFRLLGRRNGFNSTTLLQDVGEWLSTTTNLLPELNGTENLELVSSDAADDNSPGGTGTRTVRIVYLNTSYVLAFVDYALNGTVAVPVAEKMLFIYFMEALTGGASEVSVGNIDLRIAGGGAIHERINAGGNKSMSARFMVPDNYKAYVGGWTLGALGTTIDARLRATVRTNDRSLNDRYLFQDIIFIGAGAHVDQKLGYVRYPARSKLKVSVIAGSAPVGNRVDCALDVLLIQD